MATALGLSRRALAALALATCAACAGPGGTRGSPSVQLVESWPVETDLDHRSIPDTLGVWLEMIGGARETIDFAEFYASSEPGSRLEPVLEAIGAAVDRGVRVRFLSSAAFVDTYPETLARLEELGAEVRAVDYGRDAGGPGGVHHAKYFVVDGKDVFLGSQNFDWRSLEHIQELGVRVRDPGLGAELGEIFDRDWLAAGGRRHSDLGGRGLGRGHDVRVRLVASPAGDLPDGAEWDLPHLVDWIDSAEDRVWVQLLGYRAAGRRGEPWRELEAALLRASERGCDVRLMVSHWQQRASTIGGLQELQRVPGLEVRLVTIPEWSGGFIPFARTIHAKAMLVDDDRVWIGTSNWSRDYFYESRNVGLLIEDERTADQVKAFFESTWKSRYAETVDPGALYPEPRVAE